MKSKNRTHLHTHVTVTSFPEITPKGWKETTIDLFTHNRHQQDLMLTKHFMIDNDKSFIDVILTQIMFLPLTEHEIIRVKIEQESNFPDIIPDDNYLEIHAETEKNIIPPYWVFSYNPKRNDVNFVNRRFYYGNISELLSQVDNELEPLHAEYRPELIIYDSNHKHDSWWA